MNLRIAKVIAKEEWRYWGRSKLGIAASITVGVLVIVSLVSTFVRMESERESRESFQTNATETFESQPARHPHRMVHYGHYVFREPAPMAVIDPGVDAYTGTAMFLEGHRQNSAVFSPRYASAHLGPFADLSPAFAYQVLVPLLLIVLGFGAMPREREGKTDYLLLSSSVSGSDLWLGKTLALAGAMAAALIPLALALLLAISSGESAVVAIYFLLGYLAYLLVWVLVISAVSAWMRNASASFSLLLAVWVVFCVIVPRFAASTAQLTSPMVGKIASDFAVLEAVRNLGDGHNANDPAFAALRAQLLEQYDVDDVADLPINFRGVVAETAEANLTEVLNEFAEEKMAEELAQAQVVHWLGILSPTLAIRSFSVMTAGTDVRQYHTFLREAERVRFEFVQALNSVHARELSYTVDMQRSVDEASERRTRVSPSHWRVGHVGWQPPSTGQRITNGLLQLFALMAWAILAAFLGLRGINVGAREHG